MINDRNKVNMPYDPYAYTEQRSYKGEGGQAADEAKKYFSKVAYNKNDEKIHFYNTKGEEKGSVDVTEFAGNTLVSISYIPADNILVLKYSDGTTFNVNLSEVIDDIQETVMEQIEPELADFFDGAEYVSDDKKIYFYHGSEVKAEIDATDFLIDGMVEDVKIEEISGVSYLVITFNVASGKQDIKIPLTDIFNPDNYYTKDEIDVEFEVIEGKIEDEQARAESAETALAAEIVAAAGAVTAETARAESAETILAAEIATKADADALTAYTPTTGFATINNSAITEGGNLVIQGGGANYSAGTNIEISGDVISVVNISTVAGKAITGGNNVEISITNLTTNGQPDVYVDPNTGDIVFNAGIF